MPGFPTPFFPALLKKILLGNNASPSFKDVKLLFATVPGVTELLGGPSLIFSSADPVSHEVVSAVRLSEVRALKK